MARKYPRFLYSNPTDTKSKGPFVVHLLFPRFICRIVNDVEEVIGKNTYYIHQSGWTLELLDVFENDITDIIRESISDTMYQMLAWLPNQKQKIDK